MSCFINKYDENIFYWIISIYKVYELIYNYLSLFVLFVVGFYRVYIITNILL